jgi:DNA-binding transcriptional ArsR family regulator
MVGDLLARLFLHPEDQYSVTELAHLFRVSQSTVSREVDRLSEADLVHEERRGNLRLLRANVDNPLAQPLTELLALTYGPAAVLGELLAAVEGVTEAYVYGSWAARYAGEQGPPPRDIDVLIVGAADEDDIADAARAAERQLAREVNVHQVSEQAWRSSNDPFLTSVRARPLYAIDLPGDDG